MIYIFLSFHFEGVKRLKIFERKIDAQEVRL